MSSIASPSILTVQMSISEHLKTNITMLHYITGPQICCVHWCPDSKSVQFSRNCQDSLKATVKNVRGSVEKLSPKESVKGANTVLRGSVRAPSRFFTGKPLAVKPWGLQPFWFCSLGFALRISLGSPHTASQHSVGTQGTFLRGLVFPSAQRIFNSCSD